MTKRRKKNFIKGKQLINENSLKQMYEHLKGIEDGIIIAPNPNAHCYNLINKLKLELIKQGALKIVKNPKPSNYVIVEVIEGWKP